jgi:hypothetical protein
MKFPHSRKKVERAMKHIGDLNDFISAFSDSDFYSVQVQEHKGSNKVFIAYSRQFPISSAALIIGDALHNLRSALDLVYYRAFDGATGLADKWTRFPIRDEREELIASINGGLKQKKLSDHPGAIKLRDFVVDVVKAYQAGNWPLWVLHDMSIMDKHHLLIPVFKIMAFTGISLKDDSETIFSVGPYYTEDSDRFKIGREGNFAIHNKGHATTAVVFSVGVPFQDRPVIPALTQLAEAVTRTIDAFESLDLHPFVDLEERL